MDGIACLPKAGTPTSTTRCSTPSFRLGGVGRDRRQGSRLRTAEGATDYYPLNPHGSGGNPIRLRTADNPGASCGASCRSYHSFRYKIALPTLH